MGLAAAGYISVPTRGAAPAMSAADRIEMETTQLRKIQSDSFLEELKALKQRKPIHSRSRLNALNPQFD